MGSINKTETGSVLNFNTYLPKQLTETKISFTPKQSGSGTPSPENVREIVGKNGITVWQSNKGVFHNLPSAYQEVEYLESTGTQWIYTDIPGRSGIKCFGKIMWFVGGDACIFGARKTSSDRIMPIHQYHQYKWTLGYGSTHADLSTITYGTLYEVEAKLTSGEQYLKVNGETVYTGTEVSEYSNDYNMALFGCSFSSSKIQLLAKARIYYLEVDLDGERVAEFVPCYRKSDSVAGMYDLVSGTFYTNSGTGEFLVGEDIVGVETSVSFPAVGKNLFDYADGKNIRIATSPTDRKKTASNYGTITNDGNTITLTRTLEAAGLVFILGKLQAGVTYTLSGTWDNIDNKAYIALLDTDVADEYTSTRKYTISFHYNSVSFTPEATGIYEVLLWRGGRDAISASNVQLEKGSTATEYEAFNNTIYSGYVDLVNGEVVEEWTKVDMGDRNWAFSWNTFNTAPSNFTGNGANGTPIEVICDIYPSDINAPATEVGRIDKNIRCRANYKHICIRDDDYTTAADFKTAVTGHYLAYKLAEPIHYPLSPRILSTLRGSNVMWSDGDSLTISYTDDVVNTYDFRRHISLDTPHKASASGAVASFGTDMVGKMKCKIHFTPKQEGSGTPSPDNVRNISGRSSVKLWQSGGNLLDVNAVTFTSQKYIKTDGSIATSSYYKISNALPCSYLAGKTLTANTVIQAGGTSVKSLGFYSSDDITSDSCVLAVHKAYANDEYATFTVPNTAKFMIFCMNSGRTLDGRYIIEGTEPLGDSEEVDIPNEITFSWGDAPQDVDPSEVAGTIYGGYVDILKGDLVAKYTCVTLDGVNVKVNRGGYNSNNFYGAGWVYATPQGKSYSSADHYLCDKLPLIRSNDGTVPHYTVPASGYLYYMIRVLPKADYPDGLTNAEVITLTNEWLQQNPLTVVYPLVTPIHYSLTPQSIATLRNSNRIWSDGDSVEVEYWKHTDEAQEYLPIDAIVTNNGFVLVTSDGYAVGEANDYIKY